MPMGGLAVDPDISHPQAIEVEIEARQRLGGARRDGRPTLQPVGRRVVGEVEVVVRDVLPAVAVGWKVRVADAGRSRAWGLPRIRDRQPGSTNQSDQKGCKQDHEEFAQGFPLEQTSAQPPTNTDQQSTRTRTLWTWCLRRCAEDSW